MVPATINLSILIEVDEIYQQLIANTADKAWWVPANTMACSGCKDGYVSSVDLASALQRCRSKIKEGAPNLTILQEAAPHVIV